MTEYKKKLEEEKATLVAQLKDLGAKNGKGWEARPDSTGTATEFADINSSADRFEDFEEKSALIQPLEARLADIESALARIGNGTYGTCRVCGKKIEDARLVANPAAETCMEHLEA